MRDSVLIYGSGMMGCAIGCCAALANNNAILFDINPAVRENAIERVSNNLKELVDLSLITEEQAKEAMKYISISDNVESSCEKAKVVIEAVFENLEIKQDVFRVLDELLPESVPILSNTSGLRITDIAAKTKHPERTLTAHFWLPATLIPLVEVVIGDNSSPKLAEEIK